MQLDTISRKVGIALALAALVTICILSGIYIARFVPDFLLEHEESRTSVSEVTLRTSCRPGDDYRSSDLCAQWKAADAADRSAFWAMFGAIIAGMGTLGLYWQIGLTRRALEGTNRATTAMFDANRITERSQRAWLSLSIQPKVARIKNERLYIQANFCAKNIGETEATHCAIRYSVLFSDKSTADPEFRKELQKNVIEWRKKYIGSKGKKIPPGDQISRRFWKNFPSENILWNTEIDNIKRTHVVCLIAVFYRTISEPKKVQVGWDAVSLCAVKSGGNLANWISDEESFSGERLQTQPYIDGANHYTAKSLKRP